MTTAHWRQRVKAQVLSHARNSLFRNAYSLAASSASTSALGLVYWILAAGHMRPTPWDSIPQRLRE